VQKRVFYATPVAKFASRHSFQSVKRYFAHCKCNFARYSASLMHYQRRGVQKKQVFMQHLLQNLSFYFNYLVSRVTLFAHCQCSFALHSFSLGKFTGILFFPREVRHAKFCNFATALAEIVP